MAGKLWSLLPFAFHVNVMLKSLHHQVVKGKLTTVRLKICKLMFRALERKEKERKGTLFKCLVVLALER